MASTRIGPNEYNAAAIEVLEGLEPVRLRPGMYIGGTDAQGLGHLIDEAVANALDEHLAGRATRVAVTVDENDWVTVRDNGGGIPIEPRTASGLSRLEVFFTAVHSGASWKGIRRSALKW
jgi:topoisomerase-4 subunit B